MPTQRFQPNSRWLLGGVLLAALGALWLVRDHPLQRGIVRLDALSAFFLLAVAFGLLLAPPARQSTRQLWLLLAALGLALFTTLTPVIIGGYALLALHMHGARMPRITATRWRHGDLLRRALLGAPLPLASGCLALGYGALALRGTLRYDDRAAGAALNGFVFWFTLLAALLPQLRLLGAGTTPAQRIWQLAWLYPLVRLFSLGPWNSGWAFAALLFGGAAALWAAVSALTATSPAEYARMLGLSFAALVLASFALATSAGVAAGCYLLLACMLLPSGQPSDDAQLLANLLLPSEHAPSWSLASALPFAAPFVGVWMLAGAATAANLVALTGVAWLVALLGGLAWALHGSAAERTRAIASLLLGIAAPLVVLLAIEPVIEQLQGGLTVYGDINIWPWVGLSALDSAKTQVAALPSVALAGLMAVLLALVYLVARLLGKPVDAGMPPSNASANNAIIAWLRAEVPWLGGPAEERPRDRE